MELYERGPFCIWAAAHNLSSYEDALWPTASGGNDADTTCAIVGSIVGVAVGGVPAAWLNAREPLPELEVG